MSYGRVIPRDFFNEAKLLKCMGRLSLLVHDEKLPAGIKIQIESNGKPFNVERDDSSGAIYVSNYRTYVNNNKVRFETNLNSKLPYPLTCYFEDAVYAVFDDEGQWHPEFIEAFTNK